ncbi:MAG TPA: AMP-binding protein [Actinophytocola sp.]|uniref:AMP-binding protein n=1 Tax=Actinophytocola sp. TaxID=1872138 RepID=UPI002DBA3A19|nr:AMP-binding protein [Actinophytocola sp.]HEU5475527.1 AMP-binding protein [Actinophytocola sp.]
MALFGPRVDDPPARLVELARAEPDVPALICPMTRRSLTFAELHRDSDILARGLVARGVGPGVRAALVIPPGPDFLTTAFALLKTGALALLIDPDLRGKRLAECLDRIAPQAFIGPPGRLFGWARRRPPVNHTLAELRAAGAATMALPGLDPRAPALVAVCAGGTGALYRREQLAGQLDALGSTFGWRRGEVELTTVALFALFAVAAGATAVLLPPRPDPAMLANWVTTHGATGLSGTPTVLDRLSHWVGGVPLPGLRRLTVSAGAPVPDDLVHRCRAMLPDGAELFLSYGGNAALPVTVLAGGELPDAGQEPGVGSCVGSPLPGAEVEIVEVASGPIAEWEAPLPDGEPGEIVVRAPWVSAEYLDDRQITALTKIPHADGTFFHRTGDVGYRDLRGRIWFCGRAGERVIAGKHTLLTGPCEAVFNSHPAVRRSALVGPRLCDGVHPTICVELHPGSRNTLMLHKELLDLALAHEHTRAVRHVLVHRGLPMNGGIDRAALTSWAERRLR